MNRFWKGLIKQSWWVVIAFVALSALMVVGARKIQKDTSADSMNPDHNAIVELNDEIGAEFNVGRSEIIVLYSDNIYTPRRLEELREITARLEGIEGVKKVSSLANAPKMVETDGVLVTGDMVTDSAPTEEEIAGIRSYVEGNYMLKGGLFAAKDGKSTNILVSFDDSTDLPTIAAALEAPVKELWSGGYDLTGIPSLEAYMLKTMVRDMPLLSALAILVILIMFALSYRSGIGVWMPLVTIIVGLAWGAGLFGFLGLKFMSITIIAPIAILAVGSSFTMQLLGRYFLELSRKTPKEEAIVAAMGHTGLGVLVSGLAISAALLTFLISDLAMVRGIGAFAAGGVFFCMLAALLLLPALLHLVPAPKVRVKMEKSGALADFLGRLGHATGRRPKTVLGVGLLVVAIAGAGILAIVPNTSLVAFFKSDSPVIAGLRAVNKVFGGDTQATMLVEGDLQDPELLKSMLAFQEEARATIPGIGNSTSIATLVRSLHETLTGEAGMPGSRDLVAQELLVYQASGSVDDITSLVNLDNTRALVTFIAPRQSTRETKALFDKFEALAARTIGDKAKVSFAGDILTEVAIEDVIIRDFIVSISLALLLVVLIDGLVLGMRAALVTIGVLVASIIVQYGLLGITGLPFNLATALAGALAIGVGDYAIHLTVRYLEDRRRGLSPEDAVASALSTSGRSIFFTALTIGGGFTALTVGSLVPVTTLGGVMVLTVAIVGVASLTLLPAACVVFLRNPKSMSISTTEVKDHA